MARKSRKETVITAEPVPSLYVHVALYIRLSVEDNKKRGCSVENQKLVLNDFLADKPDFVVYDTYIDNGMTGTNFHRPGFQQMLSDIEAGYINCVIVKDLSRLGVIPLIPAIISNSISTRTMSVLLRLQISLIRQTPAIFTEALCFR